jgi:ABC-type transporter Mla subunit MlaD
MGAPGTAGEDRVGGVADDDTDRQGTGGSRADVVRALLEQALGATKGARGVPVGDLAEELAGAAGRLREVFEELRPPSGDDLERLRAQVARLESRVALLEATVPELDEPAVPEPATAKPSPAGKPARAKGVTAKPPAAARPAAAGRAGAKAPKATGAKGASASPGASTARRAKPAAKRPADTP